MSWAYDTHTHNAERAAIFTGVRFDTGRFGKKKMTIRWNGEMKDERDAMKFAESFLSRPLSRWWFDIHQKAGDLDHTEFIEGGVQGDLLGSATYYGSSVQEDNSDCILLIQCDT